VKGMLDGLSGLSRPGLNPDTGSGVQAGGSFRVLIAFTFQPQYVVAKPMGLFFCADWTGHRERGKFVFTCVLGALSTELLTSGWECDRLERELRRAESTLTMTRSAVRGWQWETQGWARQAVEFGLLPADTLIPSDWLSLVDLLRRAIAAERQNAFVTLES